MFQGFSDSTIDFMWGIRFNNERSWFNEHKQEYIDHFYEPMKALGKDLFQPFLTKSGNVLKVSRIYRDARMHHPLPYKESLWICIRKDVQWWAEHPCLYFEICPEGASYGFFLWKPKPAVMENFRKQIAAQPRKFLKLIRDAEKATGLPITAEVYKRPKEAPSAALAPYFAWKGAIGCTVTVEPGEDMFGPALGQRALELFEKLTPLYEYFSNLTTQ